MSKKITLFDTTLRDGTQMEGFNLSLHDKLLVAEKLDSFGIDYIEGGWPGSNNKDVGFFREVRKLSLKHSKVTAFGSTRRANLKPEEDPNIQALVEAESDAVIIFGKSWDLHVKDVLKTSLSNNLRMIEDSLAYLNKHTKGEVLYDAEHYFDGYKADPEYAIQTLKAAEAGGARCLVLCDSNGGSMPWEIREIVTETMKHVSTPLGIHTHNDCALAVANTLEAVQAGVRHIQGTINGVGERCGNADLIASIADLQSKLGYSCVSKKKLRGLVELSRFVYEIANTFPTDHQPFVGRSAFAHKGGVHGNAVLKNSRTYEHIEPEVVGNTRNITVSELAGKANILMNLRKYRLEEKPDKLKEIIKTLQDKEHEGYQYEVAGASFELLARRILGLNRHYFDLEGFRVIVEKRNGEPITEATIKIKVGEETQLMAAEGDGPVHALDQALRKALERFYPVLMKMHLTDYKVRVINATEATAASVRVVIESEYGKDEWGTVGVSENLIEASWIALVDSITYMLTKYHNTKKEKKS